MVPFNAFLYLEADKQEVLPATRGRALHKQQPKVSRGIFGMLPAVVTTLQDLQSFPVSHFTSILSMQGHEGLWP